MSSLTHSKRRGTGAPGRPHASHIVQFYESPATILDSASRFLSMGLQNGDGGVAIATPANREALAGRMRAGGMDVDAAVGQGSVVFLDAADTIGAFLKAGSPDPASFTEVVGSALSSAAAKARSGRVRAFGEMVALLCAGGNPEAAIRLEELWNELEKTHTFTLLCGYPMDLFRGEPHAKTFAEICATHREVVPGESFVEIAKPRERQRAVASLQQKAASLEAEVGHRRAAELAIVNREQELADFLENAAEGIHQVGPDGTILWANRAELDLLGYRRDEYVGRRVGEFHADRDVVEEILAKLARGETLYDQPARLVCKDGSIKNVMIHSNTYRENGEFKYTRCFTRDVTERVRLEEELRHRIVELAEVDRRKNEFLAMLGHELRNPLSPVVTAVELLRRRTDDPALVARSLEVIDRQTRHMTRLVDDLLDVSRITRGTIALRREDVSLTAVLDQAVEQVRPLIEQRGHRLVLTLTAVPIRLHADPDRLEQIFANVLINAAKYTEIGGRISVEARREEDQAVVSIRDDGMGISPEMRERIFDIFVRSDDSGFHAPGGLGVGLTLVRRLAEMHGGSVEVLSDGPGQGSEFVVRLPIPADTPSAHAAPADPVRGVQAHGRRVLVVDDNCDAADGLADFLRSLGHSVRTSYDGVTALEEARRNRPEIVVLDIGMPGLDGHEVARRLRGDVGLRSSLIVALSGYGQESDRRLSREAGFDHHLVKPIELGKLEALLKLPS
jgi:PAS domain S-box-containing protein